MKKAFPTYVDETASLYEKIYFSAGKRGVQIVLEPDKLLEVAGAEYADLIAF
jgi:Cys-tRNA(Pro)/Cys-tRNA(Cys) deacylase